LALSSLAAGARTRVMPDWVIVDQPISPLSWEPSVRSDSICPVSGPYSCCAAVTAAASVASLVLIAAPRTTSGSTMSTATRATAAVATTSAISLARRVHRRRGWRTRSFLRRCGFWVTVAAPASGATVSAR
jgi:hypothetical protein